MENSQNAESSVLDLLKQYADTMNQRQTLWKEGTRACRQQQRAQIEEIRTLKEALLESQSKNSTIEPVQSTVTTTNDSTNYKLKWEEAEATCRLWEKKFIELETGTIKQLQDKVDQLTQEYSRMKSIRERIFEVCSCRYLTETQLHDLKHLVNNDSQSSTTIGTIATKNDFHQQTIKMRNMLMTHNNELLTKIDELLNKKRKRNESDERTIDDDVCL